MPIRLLSLDYDGTLAGPWGHTAISSELVAALRGLRSRGVLFALNTGRTLPMVDEALEVFPIRPDFALTSERELFRWSKNRWEGIAEWNDACAEAHHALYVDSVPVLEVIAEFVKTRTKGRVFSADGTIQGLVASDDEEMARMEAFIESVRPQESAFSYQRNDIYLRFCHANYHKGAVLKELQRTLGISPGETFAAGDNHNDLPMLDPQVAHWLGCPSNSILPVKERVRSEGGLVADRESGSGIADVLRQFFPGLLAS
jgi:HAD superfamily hydrolase (TIGR01484 family)